MEKYLLSQWSSKPLNFWPDKCKISPNGRFLLSIVYVNCKQKLLVHDLLHKQMSYLNVSYHSSIQTHFHIFGQFKFLDDETIIFIGRFYLTKKWLNYGAAVAELDLAKNQVYFTDVVILKEATRMDEFSILVNPKNLMQSWIFCQRKAREQEQTMYELKLKVNSDGVLQFCRQSLLNQLKRTFCVAFPYFDGQKMWGFKLNDKISTIHADLTKLVSFDLLGKQTETIEAKGLGRFRDFAYTFEEKSFCRKFANNAYHWSYDRFNFVFYPHEKENVDMNFVSCIFSLSINSREWTKSEVKFPDDIAAIQVSQEAKQLIVVGKQNTIHEKDATKTEYDQMSCYRIEISRPDFLRHKAFRVCQKMGKTNKSIEELFSKYQFKPEFQKIDSFMEIEKFNF